MVVTSPPVVPEPFEAREDEVSMQCEAVLPQSQVARLLEEAENLLHRTGVSKAGEGLSRAKRAFYEAYHHQNVKRNRQTLIVEYFKSYRS